MRSPDPEDGTAQASLNADEESERIRLARLALAAALSAPGVVRGDSGPFRTHTTPVSQAAPLIGIVCAALAGGGYEVALRLVTVLVPLPALAETVTERVRASARARGLGGALQSVTVHFADIEYVPAV